MEKIEAVVAKYQELLKCSMNTPTFGMQKGIPSAGFLSKIGEDDQMLLGFLQEAGIVNTHLTCGNCSQLMRVVKKPKIEDCGWDCGKRVNGVRCYYRKSVRHCTWFSQSKLKINKCLLITNDILQNVSTAKILLDYGISSRTAADWRQEVREVMVEYMLLHTQPIGGPNSIVEIDESMFGKRKYHRGHHVKGQWVFGGIDRSTGCCFLVKVDKRDRETLTELIKKHILPGSTIISDCWAAYNNLENEGYKHLTVNHSVSFVNADTGAHTNTIESTWRHVKASLPEYNRQSDFTDYLGEYMFRKLVASRRECIFNAFFEAVRSIHFGFD